MLPAGYQRCYQGEQTKISMSERTPLLLNLSQMSSDTEYSGGLDMFAICKEITSLGNHTKSGVNRSGMILVYHY